MIEEAAATALELHEAHLSADAAEARTTAAGGVTSPRANHEALMLQAAGGAV